MARRSDHSREELKELIINTATQIITEQGLRGLTARKIAAQIGYSLGSIYNVVNTLDELISIVNTGTMKALKVRLDETEITGNAIVDVKSVLGSYMDFMSQNPRLWSANVAHATRRDIEQPEYYNRELQSVLGVVEKTLTPAFEGRSEDEVRRSIRVLWASLQGISAIAPNAKFLQEGAASPAVMAEDLVITYVRGAALR
jgi:AcrR family transcriptional regulator